MWQHLNSHRRHLDHTRKNSRVMPNITYGMIHTFGDYATTKSIRSSSSATRHLEAAIMVPLGRPGKYWTVASTGQPSSKTRMSSSPPARDAKKQEWP
ncbi:hypothetical protein CR513_46775, partial [Mucuna pruriens]